MDNPRLSIVVPAYNVGSFIFRCISSIEAERFSGSVEVIVVNDGSTDETQQVLEELLKQMASLRVIHQSNSGLGAARNRGLDEARGEYIWFVDGDDFLAEDAVINCLSALELSAPDVLLVDFSCADEKGVRINWIESPFRGDYGKIMEGGEFFRRHHATTYAWLYVFRRSMLLEHGLRFQPRINMQDAELLPRIMSFARSVYVAGFVGYVYVKRLGSFINNPDPEVREQYFRSVVEVRRRLAEFHATLDGVAIKEGLVAKIEAINNILLMAYVYDPTTSSALASRLAIMRSEGVFPFRQTVGLGFKGRLLRMVVNFLPTSFPKVYRSLREQPALQYVVGQLRGSRR